ncbi:MAG: hypothetical protein Q9174_004451, partial [Haloplaca sp. 1 TL-2023]
MATVMASKPPAPHQKIKRPPPPAVQTNGAKSSQSSPSPSLGSKRPPSAFKQPINHGVSNVNGMNGIVNGSSTARSSNNRRRDSQKPGDASARSNRPGKNAQAENNLDRRKKMAEPYVKTPGYILKKYKNKPPSLILHLHATHFRFDQQDGSFSYKTPMKIILEHLRSQTVPHDMIEELNNAGVKFYEGCLIVQVQDHRSIAADSRTSSSATTNESNKPFSIHNYNLHVTPSPFVPYPKRASISGQSDGDKIKDESSTSAQNSSKQATATSKAVVKGPKIFTTVLLPTPQSFEEEVFLWANTPDPRANNRKQSQASVAGRTPASATMPHPPTPLSAIPSTPSSGPPAKKQKMMLGESDIRNFQSKLTTAGAAPLFLDPVDSLQQATRLIKGLTDSMHKKGYPAPKTRKRTVAELEADEAQAASEQRFMLIMDERLGVSGATAKAGGDDGEAGAAAFEPRFERFNVIENIKVQQREKEQQAQEQRAINQANQQAASKHKQEQMEQHRLMQEKKNAEMVREQQMRAYQARQNAQNDPQLRAAMSAQQLNGNSNIQSHGPGINGVVSNQQQLPQNTQTQHSSPISRHMTPHSNPRSSPLVGNVPHSIPMNVTASSQGVTSSPARPTSAAQPGHPGGIGMVRNLSQQRPPSRMGTPGMPQHGTPIIKQGTPTPRLAQGSPPNPLLGTPLMNGNGGGFHPMGGQQVTPEQIAFQRSQQHQQALFNQRQLSAAQGQPSNGPTANGMASMHMPGNANHQNGSLQHFAQHNHSQQNQSLRQYQAQQQEYVQHRLQNSPMNNNPNAPPSFVPNASPPNPHNRPMPPQPGQHRPQPTQIQMNPVAQQQLKQLQHQALNTFLNQLVQTYGSVEAIPPDKQAEARQQA